VDNALTRGGKKRGISHFGDSVRNDVRCFFDRRLLKSEWAARLGRDGPYRRNPRWLPEGSRYNGILVGRQDAGSEEGFLTPRTPFGMTGGAKAQFIPGYLFTWGLKSLCENQKKAALSG
jgi:hypothetical protein